MAWQGEEEEGGALMRGIVGFIAAVVVQVVVVVMFRIGDRQAWPVYANPISSKPFQSLPSPTHSAKQIGRRSISIRFAIHGVFATGLLITWG